MMCYEMQDIMTRNCWNLHQLSSEQMTKSTDWFVCKCGAGYEWLICWFQEKESKVGQLQTTAQKLTADGDASAPQVDQAAKDLSKKWNNILGIIEARTKISRTYVTFHKTVHSVSTNYVIIQANVIYIHWLSERIITPSRVNNTKNENNLCGAVYLLFGLVVDIDK